MGNIWDEDKEWTSDIDEGIGEFADSYIIEPESEEKKRFRAQLAYANYERYAAFEGFMREENKVIARTPWAKYKKEHRIERYKVITDFSGYATEYDYCPYWLPEDRVADGTLWRRDEIRHGVPGPWNTFFLYSVRLCFVRYLFFPFSLPTIRFGYFTFACWILPHLLFVDAWYTDWRAGRTVLASASFGITLYVGLLYVLASYGRISLIPTFRI